jgi:hypothetical protein
MMQHLHSIRYDAGLLLLVALVAALGLTWWLMRRSRRAETHSSIRVTLVEPTSPDES